MYSSWVHVKSGSLNSYSVRYQSVLSSNLNYFKVRVKERPYVDSRTTYGAANGELRKVQSYWVVDSVARYRNAKMAENFKSKLAKKIDGSVRLGA